MQNNNCAAGITGLPEKQSNQGYVHPDNSRPLVLITGGAGFIGSHLAESFLAAGYKVMILDNLSTGRIENLSVIEENPDCSIIVGDVADEKLTLECIRQADLIFHLAAVVGVQRVMENTTQTIEENHTASSVVLKYAARYRRRLFLASTSEVYGANQKESFSETDDAIIGPSHYRRWCYAAGKLLDEFHAHSYHQMTGLPVTVVRLFNTIGTRQVGHYGMVVPRFVKAALDGNALEIYGDGTQRRCFTWVGDIVHSLMLLSQTKKSIGETYNIGSDNDIAIVDLAKLIIQLTGSKSILTFRSYAEVFGENFVDMSRRKPNVSKLKSCIGYAPDTDLTTALKNIIQLAKLAGQK